MRTSFPLNRLGDKWQAIIRRVRDLVEDGFIVGGVVRDVFIGRDIEKLDLDIVCKDAASAARRLAEEFSSPLIELDKKRGIYRIVMEEGVQIDIARLHSQGIEADLLGRDFTVDAIAVRLSDFSVIDPLNGILDIKKRVLRLVSERAFRNDGLRLVRAFSIPAVIGFKLDKGVLGAVRRDKDYIFLVAKERINQELRRLFSAKEVFLWVKKMYEADLFSLMFPDIDMMEAVEQGPYHHLDVLKHSFETLRRMDELLSSIAHNSRIKKRRVLMEYVHEPIGSWRRDALLKWVALWHDLGKPMVMQDRDGKRVFYGHDRAGAKRLKAIMREYKFSVRQIRFCYLLVSMHLRPGDLTKEAVTERAVYRFFRQAEGEELSVLLLSWADAWATRGRLNPWRNFYSHRKSVIDLINKAIEIRTKPSLPKLISGEDVMEILGIGPSPMVGRVLEEVREAQALGRIRTRDEALEWISSIEVEKG